MNRKIGSITFIIAFVISAGGVLAAGLGGHAFRLDAISVLTWFGVLFACVVFSALCSWVANWISSMDRVGAIREAHPEWFMEQLGVDSDVVKIARAEMLSGRKLDEPAPSATEAKEDEAKAADSSDDKTE